MSSLGESLQMLGESLLTLITTLCVLCLIFIPLGIWKLVELIIEFCK